MLQYYRLIYDMPGNSTHNLKQTDSRLMNVPYQQDKAIHYQESERAVRLHRVDSQPSKSTIFKSYKIEPS